MNARHRDEPGASFYTHVSDQFSPYHTKFIAATASDAPHVLDGLLNHQSGLRIEEHYTDTGGATDHVFGPCHLLGFRFAPRLRDIKDRRLYLFPGAVAPQILAHLVGGFVDADHIAANWSEILRLVTSIRSGAVRASAMLKKLSGYPRQNGLAVALRNIGRIERSLFMLGRYSDPELRRRTGLGLNKGEARKRSRGRSFSTAMTSFAIALSKTRPIAPPASISSSRQSSFGTPGIWPRRSPNSHAEATTFLPS